MCNKSCADFTIRHFHTLAHYCKKNAKRGRGGGGGGGDRWFDPYFKIADAHTRKKASHSSLRQLLRLLNGGFVSNNITSAP